MRKATLAFVFVLLLGLLPGIALADILDITSVKKTVEPNTIGLDERASVNLTLHGTACTADVGSDVALVIDTSLSMYLYCSENGATGCPNPPEDRINPAVNAAQGFVNQINPLPSSSDRVAVVRFAGQAYSIVAPPTDNKTIINTGLDTLRTVVDTTGTNIAAGVERASNILNDTTRGRAMIVLSDGAQTTGNDPVTAARNACNAGIKVFTIGLGSDVDPRLSQMACNADDYYPAPTPADLAEIYNEIASEVLGPVATDITISDTMDLYPNVQVVPNTISDGGIPSTSLVTWQLSEAQEGKVLSYQIEATSEGTYTMPGGTVTYNDCEGNPQTLSYDGTTFTVDEDAPPEPPTDIPEPFTITLVGGGIAALGAYMRRQRAQKQSEQP